MVNLLNWMDTYPNVAGYKRTDTSEAAAALITPKAATIRDMVLRNLDSPMTPDEMASHLGMDILSVRPRFSELNAKGKIRDSGLRRKTEMGRNAIVWERV